MARREDDGRLLLERIQIVDERQLRIVVADQQVLLIEGDGHLRGCGGGAQRGDLLVGGAVEHQHLVAVLLEDVEAAAGRIGQNIHVVAGDITKVPR